MKKIVYIIGDSLSCSRPTESVSLTHLYSFRLQELLGNKLVVIDRASPSNTTAISLNNHCILNDFSMSSFDVLLVHLGIVDCFPRTFYEHYYHLFSLLESIRYTSKIAKYIKKYFSKKRVNSLSMKPFVELDAFKRNISQLIELARKNNQDIRVFLIGICSPGQFLIERCQGIKQIIDDYNASIKEASLTDNNIFFISPDEIGLSNYLTQDGHHILPQGHKLLFQEIIKRFENENLI